MAGQNRSLEVCMLANVRVAGTRNDKYPGVPFGGTYYPAGRSADGREIPARWEGAVYINRGSYVDGQGTRRDREPDIIKLVIWNGRGRTDGKGAADNAAKYLAPGKELSCLGNIHSFKGRVYIDGQTRNKADGSIATMTKHSLTVIPGTLILGADADKQLAFEYANYQRNPQQFSFWSRPVGWAPGHPEHQNWLNMSQVRSAAVFQGGDVFGYAIVGNTAQANAPAMADNNPLAMGMANMYGAGGYNTPAQGHNPAITPQGVNQGGNMPNLPGQVNQTLNQGYNAPPQGYNAPPVNTPPQQFQQGGVPGGQPF